MERTCFFFLFNERKTAKWTCLFLWINMVCTIIIIDIIKMHCMKSDVMTFNYYSKKYRKERTHWWCISIISACCMLYKVPLTLYGILQYRGRVHTCRCHQLIPLWYPVYTLPHPVPKQPSRTNQTPSPWDTEIDRWEKMRCEGVLKF